MNPTKAAAIIALIVTIGAAGYLVYQATAVRAKYDADVTDYEHCMAGDEPQPRTGIMYKAKSDY